MHSQGERLRGSGKVKMTQKAPVSICASAQLRSGEVGASPQFRLVLSAVAAGEWRGAASPGLPLGPGWGSRFPGSALGSGMGPPPRVCPWVWERARISPGLPLGPGWGLRFPESAPGSGMGLRAVCWACGAMSVWRHPVSSLVFIQDPVGPGPCGREALFMR